MQKPDPRLFAMTCARVGARPDEIVFLDDVNGHVASARSYGMHAVVFTETKKAIAGSRRSSARSASRPAAS